MGIGRVWTDWYLGDCVGSVEIHWLLSGYVFKAVFSPQVGAYVLVANILSFWSVPCVFYQRIMWLILGTTIALPRSLTHQEKSGEE